MVPLPWGFSLTYDLDLDTAGGLSGLVLQDDLVVPRVLPLGHLDGEAGVVGVRLGVHAVARLQNDLMPKPNRDTEDNNVYIKR